MMKTTVIHNEKSQVTTVGVEQGGWRATKTKDATHEKTLFVSGGLGAMLPSLDHFKYSDYDSFYEPAEDTYLLLDALAKDTTLLTSSSPCKVCVELG